jgi:hypothetical protein
MAGHGNKVGAVQRAELSKKLKSTLANVFKYLLARIQIEPEFY